MIRMLIMQLVNMVMTIRMVMMMRMVMRMVMMMWMVMMTMLWEGAAGTPRYCIPNFYWQAGQIFTRLSGKTGMKVS